jgi:hypothetical protein
MSNNQYDNSYANAMRQAEIARQNNWPAPTQQPGQTSDSHNNTFNQYNHLGKKS